jgi:hypothetical protein
MVNEIKGNVYIIDSAGVYLTGEIVGKSSAGHISGPFIDMQIAGIGFYGTSTTSEIGLSFASANSTDFIHMKTTDPTGGFEEHTSQFKISEKVYVRVLTAGTGYIYFS